MRAGDAQAVQHGHRVGGGDGLGVAREVAGHVGGRVAAGGVDDAAVAAGEETQLRLPARMVAAELMDEQNGRAFAHLFHVQPGAVLCGDEHG